MGQARPDEKSYVEAVERRLRQLRERALVLSPEDLERVLGWFGEGVPLALVLEVMGEVFAQAAQRRPRRSPRTLAYCAPAVEEAWHAVREGRTRAVHVDRAAEEEEIRRALGAAAAQLRRSSAPVALRERIAAELDEFAAGRRSAPPAEDVIGQLERRLLEGCEAALSQSEREGIERGSRAQLGEFMAEMETGVAERALARAKARMLREAFDLPDLSLLPLLGP